MTEGDIRGLAKALKGGLSSDDNEVVGEAGARLFEELLVDIHRIADALERIAMKV